MHILLQIVLSLFIIACLIGALSILLKKFGMPRFLPRSNGLMVTNSLYLDNKRKVIIVRNENTSYVLLLGNTDILLDKIEEGVKDKDRMFYDIRSEQ